MRVKDDDSLRFFGQVFRAILEPRELAQEPQRHVADRAVALLGDDQIGQTLASLRDPACKLPRG